MNTSHYFAPNNVSYTPSSSSFFSVTSYFPNSPSSSPFPSYPAKASIILNTAVFAGSASLTFLTSD